MAREPSTKRYSVDRILKTWDHTTTGLSFLSLVGSDHGLMLHVRDVIAAVCAMSAKLPPFFKPLSTLGHVGTIVNLNNNPSNSNAESVVTPWAVDPSAWVCGVDHPLRV